ncbi:sigma-70 family RNA polymerase sigma factor [Cytobacillus kochii]|uniref:RNA polymerase sigma factor n=1 Tax=Cytobacillus kochii TaxID=859143 RepID=UPI002E1F13B8|nr:sigma-70 family RNA polymerase sigma factor [Cytobacillus kochii]
MGSDGQSFIEIYRIYHHQIFRFIYSMIEQQETAEDLTQETFIKAFISKNQVEHQDKIHSWLFSIAKNTTIDFIRKQQKLQQELYLNKAWIKNRSIPEEQFIQDEGVHALYQAINHLKTNYRNVLVLRKIKECTIKETAEILGWREDKVRITTTRAIKSLKKIWKNTYGDQYHLL